MKGSFDPDWVIAPGATLREWRLEHNLGVRPAATTCGRMDAATYTDIEDGKRKITREIAAQLERGTCIPATLWLNLERVYRAGLKAGKTRAE